MIKPYWNIIKFFWNLIEILLKYDKTLLKYNIILLKCDWNPKYYLSRRGQIWQVLRTWEPIGDDIDRVR
jgi:hypothetical protein